MNYIYQTLLKTTVLALVSLFTLAPSSLLAQVSDFAPTGAAVENACISLPSNFGYRSSDDKTSGSVSLLQDFLISKGYLTSESTGYFGGMTLKAVKNYQLDKGFGATGYVGPYTRAAIKNDTCANYTGPVLDNVNPGTAASTNGSTVTKNVLVTIQDEKGKPSYNSYLKCGNKTTRDILQYSPNTTGVVYLNTEECRKKGDSVWVSCPVGQVSNLSSDLISNFRDKTTITCSPAGYVATAATAVATAASSVCPDGTPRQFVVVGPSTGCEGHESPRVTPPSTSARCPDGTPRQFVVIGPRTGCEGHETPKTTISSPPTPSSRCPDGTLRQFVVVGPSTGCEGHETPKTTISSPPTPSSRCPDGTLRQFVVVGPSTGCEGHEGTPGTYVAPPSALVMKSSNSQSGPWHQFIVGYDNAYMVKYMPVFVQVSGLDQSKNPKLCIQEIGQSKCTSANYNDSAYSISLSGSDTVVKTITDPSPQKTSTGIEGYVRYSTGDAIKVGQLSMLGLTGGSSNNPAGPFNSGATVSNNSPIYTQIRGVSKDFEPTGCIKVYGTAGGCSDGVGYRSFNLSSDSWPPHHIIQTIIQDPSQYPSLTYEFWVKSPNGTDYTVGTFTLTSPGSGASPSPSSSDVYGVCGTAVHTCASGTNGGSTQTSTGWIWYCGGTPNDINHRSALCSSKPAAFNIPTEAQVLGASISCVDLSRNLHRGMENTVVTQLQSFLQENGNFTDSPTGFYGDKTIEAVKAYQKNQGLSITGMAYENTREAIRSMTCQ